MHETLTSTGSRPRPSGRPQRSVLRRVIRIVAILTGLTLIGGGAWYLLLFLVTRTETGTAAIDKSVRTVEVAIDSGDVQIDVAGEGEKTELHKKLTKSLRSPDEKIEQDGDTLRITTDCGEGMGRCGSDYRLTVPQGTRVKVETRLGDVSVKGVRKSVEARTKIGSVRLEHIDGDRLVAASKTGAVTLKDVKFDTAEATSKLGDVRVEEIDPFTKLRAVSKMGDVELHLPSSAGPFAVTAATKVGDRKVNVDQETSADTKVEARTKIGDVTVRND
ncbi:DUF4097 family beta strand repeat-containing protein [Streptomyces lasiicapitis]|uniref:GNAT family acetyltransferase n=1 Tax=Streptomyces lasiicapitis TaxID=1923961 RepID=A0ABQ2MM09_9ACTN|nr:DUF4097 family beta strand repeat-containing protein [Streptomyces lasiicapitis]GGO54798.1 GNAT family acetyltransferase [Streptomyces lasiicapitis]